MEVVEVGVREFREKLSEYLLHSAKPVAVTRHGATVGYFIPTRAERGAERLRALREAGAAVDAMLARAGAAEADVESAVKEFTASRKAKATASKCAPGARRRG
jgi:antitoxin (DNA-binding transcriptional repressor) of toxin-antitoxin stability system